MNKQIAQLRGQMHKLNELIHNNKRQIESNLNLASKAKAKNKQKIVILKSRKGWQVKRIQYAVGGFVSQNGSTLSGTQ